MAITFSKSISTTKLLNAYNNNVVEFKSDSAFNSVKCVITIGGNSITITPDTSNVFRFNFAEITRILFDNQFLDSTVDNGDIVVDSSLYGSYIVSYAITLTTGGDSINQTYVFVKSVEQIGAVSTRLLTEQQILANKTLTLFKGYPFDIAHYSDGNITLTNTITGYSETRTSISGGTDRIYVSDDLVAFTTRATNLGATIVSNPCWDGSGISLLRVGENIVTVVGGTTETLNIRLNDVTCGGVYLKWFNSKGGWSYWLFEPIYKEKLTVRTLGSYNLDFESIDNTSVVSLPTGNGATNTKELIATGLTNDEMLQLKDILVSPRIEMYNGTYGDYTNTWQVVDKKAASSIIQNTKKHLINFKFTIKINQYVQ